MQKDWNQELQHFEYCQDIIRHNVHRYETEYDEYHAKVQELYKAVNSGDVELYNQLMTTVSLEEHAEQSLRKNQTALLKPYFGRIDYTDHSVEHEESVYIGKNGVFKNRTEVLIADWRAPISSVYYENELGKGEYGLADEKPISIDLKLKRTYDVEEGTLKGYYDSDVASNDALLVQYLSRNKDVVLGEIIATIQKEQNEIIRKSPFANIIVQGVAGSGKTTVAMHRISYLLYNYKHRFESNEYCIIGSNDLLLNYITSGLPELDVPNIKHMRMDQLFIRLCEKDWQKRNRVVEPDDTAHLRCTMQFMQELDLYLMYKREELIDTGTYKDAQLGTILSESNNTTLFRETPTASVNTLLSMMDDRVKTRIKFLMSGMDRDLIAAKLKEHAGHYKNMRPKASIYEYYMDFLTSWATQHGYDRVVAAPNIPTPSASCPDISKHLARLSAKEYDLYDIASLALIHYRLTQKEPNQEFGLLFLDEAQDFGMAAYYVLKKLLPATYFTIMGDVSQNINYYTGLNDWYELQKLFLTGDKDCFMLLQKSYRNTIEISEYAGKILEKASFGRYKITPVIRHGIPVNEKQFWSDMEMAEYTAELIEGIREKGYTTTAIICNTEAEAERTRRLLADYTPLTDGDKNNFSKGTMILPIRYVKGLEFDTVILWNPDMKHGLEKPETAKLLYVACTRALHELHILNS
ncbi:MAG: ATP-binding domain-containing protein [Lachnospiraceae bacterium]|nr:ATP-binding domain-containing protein [Lachnospiraceae bacterium]